MRNADELHRLVCVQKERIDALRAENDRLRTERDAAEKQARNSNPSHTKAWLAVIEALGSGWTDNGKTDLEAAVNTIRELRLKSARYKSYLSTDCYLSLLEVLGAYNASDAKVIIRELQRKARGYDAMLAAADKS